ncbi:MAG: hypothetical protein JWN40_1331 [Phycisphaerales bacterium]|nr:hypothetical protein [Phycisphaerales bacterium]
MKPLLRILLNAATVMSLLMFGMNVMLWVRSYRVGDVYGWGGAGGMLWVSPSLGKLCFDCERLVPPSYYLHPRGWFYNTAELRDYYNRLDGNSDRLKFAGFRMARRHQSHNQYGWDYDRLVVPIWFPTFTAAILPGLFVRRS